jgi:type II secretory pathway pseudopilin PulG
MLFRKIKTEKRVQTGFSLIELLVAMVIVIIIIGFLAGMITGIQREFNDQRPRMEALNNVSMALDNVIRIVRMAGSKAPTCDTLSIIPLLPSASAGSGVYNALQVQADWNVPDCNLSGVDEDVKFSVKDGNFYLDAAQSEPFAENIKAMRFKFYDSGNSLITDAVTNAANITYIEVEFETTGDTATVLKSGVRLRSR